jgi:hypothetical protein
MTPVNNARPTTGGRAAEKQVHWAGTPREGRRLNGNREQLPAKRASRTPKHVDVHRQAAQITQSEQFRRR